MISSSFTLLVIIATLSLVIGIILGVFATILWVGYIRKEKPAIVAEAESPKDISQDDNDRTIGVEGKIVDIQTVNQFQEVVRFGYTQSGEQLAAMMENLVVQDLQSLSQDKAARLRFYVAALIRWMKPSVGTVENTPEKMDIDATVPIKRKSEKKNSVESVGNKKSIAYQVNEILQDLLGEQTEITRTISIKDGKAGSLVFRIDDETFSNIESIPYPEVKAMIERAAATWNEREKNLR